MTKKIIVPDVAARNAKKCDILNCIVGPAICKVCKNCDNPCIEEKKNEPARIESKRVHTRERAIRMVERELQAAFLYENTRFPLHSNSKQRKNVSSENGVRVVEKQGEKEVEIPKKVTHIQNRFNRFENAQSGFNRFKQKKRGVL